MIGFIIYVSSEVIITISFTFKALISTAPSIVLVVQADVYLKARGKTLPAHAFEGSQSQIDNTSRNS